MEKVKLLSFILMSFVCFSSCKEKSTKNIKETAGISKFNYSPIQPVNGMLYGVVELGASGFNSFIVEVDKRKNWKYNNIEYGTSLLVEGMTNTMLINQKLKEYINKLLKFGLVEGNIHFVVSSGARKEDITNLIIKELNNLNYTVNTIVPSEEGKFALRAILPKEFEQNSFTIDLGSGNTKISFLDKNNSVETIETYGSKYYQKGFEDEEVYSQIRKEVSELPENKREKCFIIGGVPYEMANLLREEKEKMYTVLHSDIETYSKLEGKKNTSGLNIFRAIQDETKVKQTIYFLNGNFAVGFLLAKIDESI